MKKLNLGCGNDIKEGYINLDKFKNPRVDIVHNLEKFPYPFKDNYFDEIFASKVLEHINIPFDMIMKEWVRITKNKGIIKILIPHFSSSYSFYPTHVRTFAYMNFDKSNNPEMDFLNKVKITKRKIVFEKNKILFYNYLIEKIVNFWKFPYHYERTGLHNLFPASYMYIEFKVVKSI